MIRMKLHEDQGPLEGFISSSHTGYCFTPKNLITVTFKSKLSEDLKIPHEGQISHVFGHHCYRGQAAKEQKWKLLNYNTTVG